MGELVQSDDEGAPEYERDQAEAEAAPHHEGNAVAGCDGGPERTEARGGDDREDSGGHGREQEMPASPVERFEPRAGPPGDDLSGEHEACQPTGWGGWPRLGADEQAAIAEVRQQRS
jgi:hypothetical protein